MLWDKVGMVVEKEDGKEEEALDEDGYEDGFIRKIPSAVVADVA